jgi:hypothetical protein
MNQARNQGETGIELGVISQKVELFVVPAVSTFFFKILVCEAIGTAATPGLLCQPRVIVKIIVENQMECRLAGETKVLGENLPQRHCCEHLKSCKLF